ncbi:MAG: hypothetical protein JXA53_03915 [Bacteroidales bacterium]|nr:hypothetical protein [Bacteroidales bacterium]
MLEKIRKSKYSKFFVCLLSVLFMSDVFIPNQAFALTGGPQQPEVTGFTPIEMNNMVDPFTGDLTYNIPLFDVGGYPINLVYNSGVSMDQEASWVGLGWSLNPGVLNRNMRGIPDEFDYPDKVEKHYNVKSNKTYGGTLDVELELLGSDFIDLGIDFGIGISYNNYTKWATELTVSPSLSIGKEGSVGVNAGVGLAANSETGLDITPSLGVSQMLKGDSKIVSDQTGRIGLSAGLSYNSRTGLKALNINTAYSQSSSKILPRGDKPKRVSLGGGLSQGLGGMSYTFASPTYTPKISMPMSNISLTLGGTLGTDAYTLHPGAGLEGYFSSTYIQDTIRISPAYGYMNLQNNYFQTDGNVLLDFNREKDGNFVGNIPNLPLANLTYDIFTINAQGVGGSYRPSRSDVGYTYDNEMSSNPGDNVDVGVEIGAGGLVHTGFNTQVTNVRSRSGRWNPYQGYHPLLYLMFKGKNGQAPFGLDGDQATKELYESFYFRKIGEKTVESDPLFYNNIIKGDTKVHIPVKNGKIYLDKNDPWLSPTCKNYRQQRSKRTQELAILNGEKASSFGVEKKIFSYAERVFDFDAVSGSFESSDPIERVDPWIRKSHHPSEIITYTTDGLRYVFGIPAYNNVEKNVTFATNGTGADCTNGLIKYTNGIDNSTNNTQGNDNFYDRTHNPAYAHSYLLTEILSSDYLDSDGIDGPSIQDLGSYTKFNYSRVDPSYKWRMPYEDANYDPGLKSLSGEMGDDKASYVYGEKELWYMHSIETKTQVAQFYINSREDGYGVKGEQGGRDDGKSISKQLDSIQIYSIYDKIKNGDKAVPIKTVHFVYSNELCNGISNNKNNHGKLTLKEVYFTYGNSKKGIFNKYVFNYGERRDKNGNLIAIPINPDYNLKGYDRWGNYKPNNVTACDKNTEVPTYEYPYTPQDKLVFGDTYFDNSGFHTNDLADVYATAWNLTSIELPSGGKINIDYESDDYAYVQNKRAMRMFNVIGCGATGDANGLATALNTNADGSKSLGNYFFIKLEKPYPAQSEAINKYLFYKDYLEDMVTEGKDMYFRFSTDFPGPSGVNYEYVPGYARIRNSDYGVVPDGTYAYIALENPISKGIPYNVVSFTGYNFAKLHLPKLAYNQADPEGEGISQIIESMANSLEQITSFSDNFYGKIAERNFCANFLPAKSYIRLYEPDKIKKGGGLRVKRVTISDEWANMTTSNLYDNALYGQEYDYTTEEEGKVISSGVAAYEPMPGNDENPFRTPVSYSVKYKWAPSEDYYMETPFGETFFPSPVVGYSKVTVKNLKYNNVKTNATGKIVHEFYTARDFPTLTDQSTIDTYTSPKPKWSIFGNNNIKDHTLASQAYLVELNDMHGKQKAQWIYPEDLKEGVTLEPDEVRTALSPISGVEYFFKKSNISKLDNQVDVISPSGEITTKNVGIDYDLAIDMRESFTSCSNIGTSFNGEGFMASIIPLYIPTIFISNNNSETMFRSVVTTKVINRTGLLDRTVAWDNGSSVETKNLLFDSETGEVLLTEVSNQYVSDESKVKDKLYSFTYPAHWGYDLMGPVSKTIKAELPSTSSLFRRGDMVQSGDKIAWITEVKPGNVPAAVDYEGKSVSFNTTDVLTIVKTGRKNQQSQPIGTVVTNKNPISYINGHKTLAFDGKILNASAIEYTDTARVAKDCLFTDENDYLTGFLGNWRPKRSYAYLSNRTQTTTNNNTDIRRDGYYTDFTPFWKSPIVPSGEWSIDKKDWTFTSEVTIYNSNGGELENKDALGIYSSASFGYNYTLPISVAGNAQYRENGFEGFEDYNFGSSVERHFNFVSEDKVDNVTNQESHSGRYSIKLAPGETTIIDKPLVECDK